jgi:hypothetical protein
MCLHLADGEHLLKNSYVTIKPTRIVRIGMLRSLRQGKCRLGTKSLRELLKVVRFQPPWPITKKVRIPAVVPRPAPRPLPVQYQLSMQYQLPVHYQTPVRHQLPELGHNHHPRATSYGSNYHVPGQWITTHNRPSHGQPPNHHTPLLPPAHVTVGTPVRDASTSSCVNVVFTLISAAILLLVLYTWYIGTP